MGPHATSPESFHIHPLFDEKFSGGKAELTVSFFACGQFRCTLSDDALKLTGVLTGLPRNQ